MIRIKMNQFLNTLGVRFSKESEEFEITINETKNVKSLVNYYSFPQVKHDYNTGELYIEIGEPRDIDILLSEIVEFIKTKKEEVRKVSRRVAKILEEELNERN